MKGFNAMFRFAYANQNNAAASAMCAEAASSCTSQSSRFNCIVLGAIIMASIIISRLITVIGISLAGAGTSGSPDGRSRDETRLLSE